jgi:hypothetical protein
MTEQEHASGNGIAARAALTLNGSSQKEVVLLPCLQNKQHSLHVRSCFACMPADCHVPLPQQNVLAGSLAACPLIPA